MFGGLLVACSTSGSTEEDGRVDDADVSVSAAHRVDVDVPEAAVAQTSAPGELEEAPPVKLFIEFDGIGALHKSFFMDERVTAQLQQRLRGHVDGAVGILVGFNHRSGRGNIRIQVSPERLTVPLGQKTLLDLNSVVPLTKTAAFYRDWVASNFDFRVLNFDVGLDVTPNRTVCAFELDGAPPPDGSKLAPCFTVDGAEVCGNLQDMKLSISPAHHEAVGRCL